MNSHGEHRRIVNTAAIYCLEDPVTGEIRYVGKTIQPLSARLQQHIYPARVGKHNHPKAVWVRDMISKGCKPVIKLLQYVPATKWREAERAWVEMVADSGDMLTNNAPAGGGGDSSHKGKMTPWAIERLGRLPDEEIAAKIGLTRKAVAYHRNVRGIPPCGNREECRSCPPLMAGHNKKQLSEEVIRELGTKPDYVIAESAGVSKKLIASSRKRLGIASYAKATGNNGKYKAGNYPARWNKN